MPYRIIFKPSALREFQAFPPTLRVRLGPRIDRLASHPRGPGSQKMQGEGGCYRVRVGDYRVVYVVDDGERIVWILKIGHRGDVYRDR